MKTFFAVTEKLALGLNNVLPLLYLYDPAGADDDAYAREVCTPVTTVHKLHVLNITIPSLPAK